MYSSLPLLCLAIVVMELSVHFDVHGHNGHVSYILGRSSPSIIQEFCFNPCMTAQVLFEELQLDKQCDKKLSKTQIHQQKSTSESVVSM